MIFVLLFFSAENLFSQAGDPLRIYLNVDCYQKGQVKELKATIRARIGENNKILPVPGIPVDFYNQTDSAESLLGTATSDENGEALYIIEEGTPLYPDAEKGYTFTASFEGNENFRKASSEVSIREARIEIGFEEVDSIRTISAEAYEIDPVSSAKVLLEDIDLSFYVRGSFSLYKISDEELHNGKCAIDFPVTLPGDSLGNLTIIAKIEENDDYGNVEASAVKDWGVVRDAAARDQSRRWSCT